MTQDHEFIAILKLLIMQNAEEMAVMIRDAKTLEWEMQMEKLWTAALHYRVKDCVTQLPGRNHADDD